MVLAGPYGCVGRSWTTYLKKYFLASYLKLFIRNHCAVAKRSTNFWQTINKQAGQKAKKAAQILELACNGAVHFVL